MYTKRKKYYYFLILIIMMLHELQKSSGRTKSGKKLGR